MPKRPPAAPTSTATPASTGTTDVAIGYLVSRYPAASHTFILREVERLGALGLRIETASINRPDRADAQLTAAERRARAQTFYVKAAGPLGAWRAHWATLRRRPGGYLRGLALALRLGGSDLRQLLFGWFYFIEAVLVGDWLTQRGLAHLHVHFATPAATVGLLTKRVFGTGLSLTVHGPDEFYDVTRYRLREKIAGADFICCISHYCRSQLMQLAPATQWPRLKLAPLGVDAQQFAPRPFRPHPAPFQILCVGRLVAAKGQQVLLAALAELLQAGRDVHLCLVGDGPERAALQAQVATLGLGARVTFAGVVNQDGIRAYYAAADLFALASFAEGLPVVLMEAMAMEIPCVTTWITGHPELIRDGQDGLLVAPGDSAALAAAIARLIDDPPRRQALGAAARRRVMAGFDLDANTERLAAIFRRRLEDRR